MNIIISFAGLKSHPKATPYPLRAIAGGTILGHLLVPLLDLPLKKLILILDSDQEQVQQWFQQNLPDLGVQIFLVEDAGDPVSALKSSNSLLEEEPLFFISGNYIVEADYSDLGSAEVDASCLLQPEQNEVPAADIRLDDAGFIDIGGKNACRWAGSFWLRNGKDLASVLESGQESTDSDIASLLYSLTSHGLKISTGQAVYCLDTRSASNMLYANARLLGLDLGTQDAIERSYAEDFTVLPPVFLHETAVIENSVIGPYVNLEAHASVSGSIVRNSLIGPGSQISNAILEDSLIGDNVTITGQSSTLIVENGAVVELGSGLN